MIRLNSRQLLPTLGTATLPLVTTGPNGIFAGSEVMTPDSISVTDQPPPVSGGRVIWPGSGSWRRIPDPLVRVLFADSFDLSVSLSLDAASYSFSGNIPVGQILRVGPEGPIYFRAPVHSALASEYEVAPKPPVDQESASTKYQESDFNGGIGDDATQSTSFEFGLPGNLINIDTRSNAATYHTVQDVWSYPLTVLATSYADTNREPDPEAEDQAAKGRFSRLVSGVGVANFSLALLGGTWTGALTGVRFDGDETFPDSGMSFQMTLATNGYRSLH